MHRLKFGLARNDAGAWGHDPGPGDITTTVWRSTEVDPQGSWIPEPEPAERFLSRSEASSTALDRGDLLVTKSSGSAAHVGKAALVTDAQTGDGYSNFMQRLRPRNDQDPKYLWYLLNSRVARVHYDRVATTTSGLRNLNGKVIGEMPLPLVDLRVQSRVAALLDRECERIAGLAAALHALGQVTREEAQAVVEEDLANGEALALPLAAATDAARPIMYGIVLPGEPVEDGVLLVKGGNVERGELQPRDLVRVAHSVERPFSRARLARGDVLVTIRGSYGAAATVPDALVGANITQDTARVSTRPGVAPSYLVHALRSPGVQRQIHAQARGTGVRGVNIRDLRRVKVPLPPLEDQLRMASKWEVTERRVESICREAHGMESLLIEYREALITEAVTGKLDVTRLSDQQLDASAHVAMKGEQPEVLSA